MNTPIAKEALILVSLFFSGLMAAGNSNSSAAPPFLLVDYRQSIPVETLYAYDILILSSDMAGELPVKVDPGQTRLGYLSIAEIAPDASYRENALASGVEFAGRNEVWNSDLVDPSSETWQDFVLESLAPQIIGKGFDGFFLDTAESIEFLAQAEPKRAESIRSGLVYLVKKLRASFPESVIVINRGFAVLPELYSTVDGVLAESLYRSYDFTEGIYQAVPPGDSEWLLGHLNPASDAGLSVYIIDFLPRTERVLAEETAERIRSNGFIPLVSEPDLMGEVVAPLPVIPRKMISLYGQVLNEGEFEWAEDTDSMSYFQVALEYLGYELEFRNYQLAGLPRSLPVDVGGVLIDSTLQIPAAEQMKFVEWLEGAKESGRKILFVGSLPVLGEKETRRLAAIFGLEGSLSGISEVDTVDIIESDPSIMGFEAEIQPSLSGNLSLIAPKGAEVYVDVEVKTRAGRSVKSQPVFTADWGGVAIYPFVASLNPEQNPMLWIDPFAFLEKMFDLSAFPVPDTTTLQGNRIYFSHIDGDGFLNFSEVAPGTRSGIVIRDRIIEEYGLPVTVSFIESEINGDSTVYTEREGESFVDEARAVFANPYVETASHTYSHPFFWSYADPTSQSYATQNVNIRTEFNYDSIRFPREIVDSIDYMNDELKVPGKTADILLWSGNCRPPPDALKVASDAGILNLNGGNTVITKRAPYLALISPKAVRWGGQTQVYAPIQNENNFNNSFGNNRFGGYANVIQTFEMTETPRRLKPLNVYYHFYSADRFDAFTALRRVLDYCEEQAMHPIWATEFCRIVLDSIDTGIYRIASRAWRIVNQGISQTFRLPVDRGFPDLERSKGIIGFSDFQGQRYFHTDGRKRVDLFLIDTAPTTPFLRDSRVTISGFQADENGVVFDTSNRSREPMEIRLGGMGNRSDWSLLVGEEQSVVRSSPSGTLILNAPSGQVSWRLTQRRL